MIFERYRMSIRRPWLRTDLAAECGRVGQSRPLTNYLDGHASLHCMSVIQHDG